MSRFRLNRPFTIFDRVRTLKRIVTVASKDDGGKGKECIDYINLTTWDMYEGPGRAPQCTSRPVPSVPQGGQRPPVPLSPQRRL